MFCRPFRFGLAVWLILACSATCLFAAGEKSGRVADQYHVTQWTAEDGIPHYRINALAQTPDGYIWIGTWCGLARFDGLRFTAFTELNHPDMVDHTVNALTVDNEGRLWIGTADGLLSYEHGRFTRFTKSDGLPHHTVWRLEPSHGGGVWMDCGGSVVHWRNHRATVAVRVIRSGNEDVRSLRENADGSLTVATSRGVKRVTPQGELMELPASGEAPAFPWGGAWRQHRDQRFWVSTQHALWLWSDGRWKETQRGTCGGDGLGVHFMYEDRAGCLWVNRMAAGFWRCASDAPEPVTLGGHGAEQSVICMLEDAEGDLWFGTGQGLFQLRPKRIRTFTTEDGLPHEECQSVCEAPDGAVWVETRWGGAVRIQNERARKCQDEPGRHTRDSILVDRTGTVWFGNAHGGLISWRPGQQTNWFWQGTKPGVTLNALYLDHDGRVWVGTDRGATWMENGQPAAKWGDFGLPQNAVRSIYQSRDGTMWFGTWMAGVVRWNIGQASSPAGSSGVLPGDSIQDAARSRANSGAAGGPVHSQAGTPAPPWVTRFTTADGLADDRVFVFHEDAEGALWIGTRNGVSRVKHGRFFTFRTEQGLPDNPINWLEEDDFGRLWFSGNRGIFRIARAELNAVAEGKKGRANVAVYGTADGMISPATSGEYQPAGCKTRDGRIWFPTPQGVVVIDPSTITDDEIPPGAVIEQVVADDVVIYGDGVEKSKTAIRNPELKLAAGRARLLKIQYTANSFADPRRVHFQYQLTGRDRDWREITGERVAYYTDLKPGHYRFKVKAANAHGFWNETPAGFEFSLAPHFYETWPCYVLCAAGVVLIGLGIHHRRVRVLRRIDRLQREQALQTERARIARDLHDDLGANLTGIALKADLAQRQLQSAQVAGQLADIAANSRALVDNMRGTVWALNPQHDTLEGLARFLAQQVEDFVTDAGLRCRLELPESLPGLTVPSPARYHLHLVVKEALNNAVKHARASEVHFGLKIDGDDLCLCLADDGQGFELRHSQPSTLNVQCSTLQEERSALNPQPPEKNGGHGLVNMRVRVESLGGQWTIESGEKGTCICIRIPTRALCPASR